jgi:carboxynorspermidine decarboxylase
LEGDYAINAETVKKYNQFQTPCFVVERGRLLKNCETLEKVKTRTGVMILLALKGFAMYSVFDDIRDYLDGVCASSPHEARLGREEFKKDVHAFAAAYSKKDYDEICRYANHIVFNSMDQYQRFERKKGVEYGLRVNPRHSEIDVAIYDPCAPFSRLGIISDNLPDKLPDGITGLHMHTLCEKNSDAFSRTFHAAEKQFADHFKQCSWINFGGGHHITRDDYDIDLLCDTLNGAKDRYNAELYLEPGEAVALNTGFLVASVLDIVDNGMKIAIVDTSAAAHIPDVLEMPYRPHIIGSGKSDEKLYTYRIGGLSCLAGDIIGDYSFDRPLAVGDKLIFTDMAHYSMVKTNTFNGLTLPHIIYYDESLDKVLHKKSFGYETFKERLS